MKPDEPSSIDHADQAAILDRELAALLRAPAPSTDLQARVLAAVARDEAWAAEQDRARRALEESHARALAALRGRTIRLCREAALCMIPLLVTAMAVVDPLTNALTRFLGDGPGASLLILGAVLTTGLAVLGGAFHAVQPRRAKTW